MEGVIVIFCCNQVETKTSTGITTLLGSGSDRSIQRNDALSGAAVYMGNTGIQAYHFSASATRLSGREYRVCISTRKRPNNIGICITRGPRQPTGLTPASRYIRIVSCDTRWRSLPYRSWISRILGCRSIIARICRNCLMVSGSVTRRTMTVKTMIATPMLLKQMV